MAGGFFFSLHEFLLALQDTLKEESNQDESMAMTTVEPSHIDSLFLINNASRDDIDSRLNELVDQLQSDSSIILSRPVFDLVQSFTRYLHLLEAETLQKYLDIIFVAMGEQIKSTNLDLSENAQHNFEHDKIALQMYLFISYWIVMKAEQHWSRLQKDAAVVLTKSKGGRSKQSATAKKAQGWNWPKDRFRLLDQFEALVELALDRFIIEQSDRETMLNLITRSIALMLEDTEVVKNEQFLHSVIDVISLSVSRFESASMHNVEARVLSEFLREEYLADFVADFLHNLVVNHTHTRLLENVLRELGRHVFMEREQKLSKAASRFLIRISEKQPKETLKQMVYLQTQLDSESYGIRCAMIDVIGNIIHFHLARDSSENAAVAINSYYEILLERFRDVNAFVRARVLQVLMRLTERRINAPGITDIPLSVRPAIVKATIGRLEDKTSVVRKNAVKLLTKLVETSPFMAVAEDQGKLSLVMFKSKELNLSEVIKAKFPPSMAVVAEESSVQAETENVEEEFTQDQKEESPASVTSEDVSTDLESKTEDATVVISSDPKEDAPMLKNASDEDDVELRQLRGLLKYYQDGITFIQDIEKSIPTLLQLLASSGKTEVVETMRFFVVAHRLGMECAIEGIRKMVHKIWDKSVSETESKSIRDYLVDCYQDLYMEPIQFARPAADVIADNLIQLIQTMNSAEIISLEQLLILMAEQDKLHPDLSNRLFTLFCAKSSQGSSGVARHALTLLGMVGNANKEWIMERLDSIIHVGLAESQDGHIDFGLARAACIVLQKMAFVKREKGSLTAGFTRMDMSHPLFSRLANLILNSSMDLTWFPFAEQALNVIYTLAEHPDVIVAEILKKEASRLFGSYANATEQVDDIAAAFNLDLNLNDDGNTRETSDLSESVEKNQTMLNADSTRSTQRQQLQCHPIALAKFCFLVGHIAIKQIVHLEAIESEWKRRRLVQEAEKLKQQQEEAALRAANGDPDAKKNGAIADIDQVTGSAEDEFVEHLLAVRESELLFGSNSILRTFAPIISHVCLHNRLYNHPVLQIMAVMALSKLMCVSAQFCDAHLQLLFTILEKSDNPIIRSNTIIGLGDISICFNSLIDQNISNLYDRLRDKDGAVKKNTLMVLTFLILNGMVKVKGQLSEMAKCLEDSDPRISDLAKLFFTELSTKDNAIYNNLPDMISNLSSFVDEGQFRNIMKFLMEFIKKERQSESIIDKLCNRFRNSTTERQWRDVAFCLSLLSFGTEKSVKKLMDYLPDYQDKLHEPVVYKHLQEILAKAKKILKSEMKTTIEEFESVLVQWHEKCMETHHVLNATSEYQKRITPGMKVKLETTMSQENEVDDLTQMNEAMEKLTVEGDQGARPPVQQVSQSKSKNSTKLGRRVVDSDEDTDDHDGLCEEDEEGDWGDDENRVIERSSNSQKSIPAPVVSKQKYGRRRVLEPK